jgi:hypothetical protein
MAPMRMACAAAFMAASCDLRPPIRESRYQTDITFAEGGQLDDHARLPWLRMSSLALR